ncbi:MAG TPA: nucleotidyltransferase [Prolixibacteraceae bacterium]|nr:nucleotidyltransferase [Prolixibacteraceae bacterium]
MPAFNEQTLDSWRKPASENEEQKISNAISMIKDAIKNHSILKTKDIEFVIQGSYSNNTNVRLDSDIDVTAMLKDTFYSEYREGATRENYGFTEGTNNFNEYRAFIIEAMQNKFGKDNIRSGGKAIFIKSNTYRVHADVVPAFQFRNYHYETKNNADDFIEGIKFFSTDSKEIINYPKIHLKNGITKNDNTLRRFKRTVRLYKRIKNKMIEAKLPVSGNIRSFLLESLLWNVPNSIFNNTNIWNEILRETIISLYNSTKTDEGCKNWGEVSEQFYLFHSDRIWSRADVNSFLVQMWNYLEYKS